MSKFKLPLICFGLAFVLSSTIGIISGVRLFTLLFRAFCTGIIISCFFTAALLFLKIYIPELFESGKGKNTENSSIPAGSSINITINDDVSEGQDMEAAYDSKQLFEESHAAADSAIVENKNSDDLLEKSDEDKGDVSVQEAPKKAEISSGKNSNAEISASKVETKQGTAELDDLPDLDDFEEPDLNTEKSTNTPIEETAVETESGDIMEATELQNSGADVELMAKAIKTLLAGSS